MDLGFLNYYTFKTTVAIKVYMAKKKKDSAGLEQEIIQDQVMGEIAEEKKKSSMFIAKANIKHLGKKYMMGDVVPDVTEELLLKGLVGEG